MDPEFMLQELEETNKSLQCAQALLDANPEDEQIQQLFSEVYALFQLQLEEINLLETKTEGVIKEPSINSSVGNDDLIQNPVGTFSNDKYDNSPEGLSDNQDESEDSTGEPMSTELVSYQTSKHNSYGFGFDLLKKMGYKQGEGLGKNKQGIIEPVEVKLWSNGESIDRLIQKRDKKRNKTSSKPKKEAPENQLFSFINQKLNTNPSLQPNTLPKPSAITQPTKSVPLNIRSSQSKLVSLQEKIVRLETQIKSLKTRQSYNAVANPKIASELGQQIKPLLEELSRLRTQERKESTQINSHKTRSKMTEF